MRFGSVRLGAVIIVVTFAILLWLEVIPYVAGGGPPPPSPPTDRPLSFGEQFAALPPWVVVWMHFQDIIMGASLFFALWRREAQIYAAGIIANHVFLFAIMPLMPPEKVTLGAAALSHWLWLIPLVVLVRAWPSLDKRTGYGTWATVAIAQLVFSLIFDLPDGAQFLLSLA